MPPNDCLFYITRFFTVDRKSSQTKTFSQNIIHIFCLYHFSVKCIIKKNYLRPYGPQAVFNQIINAIGSELSHRCSSGWTCDHIASVGECVITLLQCVNVWSHCSSGWTCDHIAPMGECVITLLQWVNVWSHCSSGECVITLLQCWMCDHIAQVGECLITLLQWVNVWSHCSSGWMCYHIASVCECVITLL